MTKSFSEQLAEATPGMKLHPPVPSNPRCKCHGKYLREFRCPNFTDAEAAELGVTMPPAPPVETSWQCQMKRCGIVNEIWRNRCRICGFTKGSK